MVLKPVLEEKLIFQAFGKGMFPSLAILGVTKLKSFSGNPGNVLKTNQNKDL